MGDDGLEWMDVLQVVGNGQWWMSLDGKGLPSESDSGATGFVRFKVDPSRPVFPAPVRLGLTINLGNYESARVDVTVEPISEVAHIQDAWDWAEEWATEILNREAASAKGKDRKPRVLPDPPECVRALVLGLQYGLTINLGNFESVKIDYGYTIPANPQQALQVWTEMSSFVGSRIAKKVAKVRSGKTAPKTYGKKTAGTGI